jgi:glycosyltransferase involved in cell wall biosynthesis
VRLAVIAPSCPPHLETFIRAHVDRLPAAVEVLCGGYFPHRTSEGAPLLGWPRRLACRLCRSIGLDPRRIRDPVLERLLRRRGVQAVVAEYGPTGVAVMRACRTEAIPLVVHFHGYDAYEERTLRSFRPLYAELFETAAAVIAVSRDMEERLLAWGAPRERLHRIPCGVDTAEFSGAVVDRAAPSFLAVGRFVEKKGPHLTLAAFRMLRDRCREARLVMIGDGPLLQRCRTLVDDWGLSSQVELRGARPHSEVAATMRRARGFVQHSIRSPNGDCEGAPVAVMEAGASGLPVVATRHGGIPDIVIDGETGLLVEEGDVAAMSRAMERIAEDRALAAALGAAAGRRIAAHFSVRGSIERLWAVIEGAVGSPATEARRPATGRNRRR